MKRLIEMGMILLVMSLSILGCNKPAEGDPAAASPVAASTADMTARNTPLNEEVDAAAAVQAGIEMCAGCAKPEAECTCAGEGHGEAVAGEAPAGEATTAPTAITLASGKSVPVVGVAALNQDPKAHSGLIAIDGTVGELYADKGRFMLVDCVTAAACEDPGCAGCGADMKVPVRFDVASVKGDLPAAKQRVFVVAEVTPTETGGFELKLQEIRTAEKTLCTAAAPAAKA